MVVVLKKNKQTTNKIPLRKPSEVMKLERLGSFINLVCLFLDN